jgi:hypothetical protein
LKQKTILFYLIKIKLQQKLILLNKIYLFFEIIIKIILKYHKQLLKIYNILYLYQSAKKKT